MTGTFNPNEGLEEVDGYDYDADVGDSYFTSAKDRMIDRERADKELNKHGVDDTLVDVWKEYEEEFWSDPSIKQIKAQDLLAWLGY